MEEQSTPAPAVPDSPHPATDLDASAPLPIVRPVGGVLAPKMSPQEMAELFRTIGAVVTHPAVLGGIRSVVAQVKGFVAALRPALAAVGSVVMFLGEAMQRLPAELHLSVLALANRGWFFDPEMTLPDMWRAKALIESGKADHADSFMAAHFEGRMDEIEVELAAALPHRAPKFKSAFAAHRRGEYDLSILAFMAQADGVCAELRGGYFFLKNRASRKPEAAAYAASFDANFIDRIAHLALTEDLPIREQMRHWAANGSAALNRHAVMHGGSLDYDTKENSLRALSLLNYVALSLDLGEGSALAEAGKAPLASIAQIATQSESSRNSEP